MGYGLRSSCLPDRPNTAELRIIGAASNWWEGDTPRYDQVQKTLEMLTGMIAKLPPNVTDLDIRLNCVGGAARISHGLVDFLARSRFRVITSIEKWAFSAGATISQAGHVRRMASDGVIMVHPSICHIDLSVIPTLHIALTASELRKLADALDHDDRAQEQLFTQRTGRDVEEIRKVYERYLNAQEALELNLIDEIFVVQEPLEIGNGLNYGPDRERIMAEVNAALSRRKGSAALEAVTT